MLHLYWSYSVFSNDISYSSEFYKIKLRMLELLWANWKVVSTYLDANSILFCMSYKNLRISLTLILYFSYLLIDVEDVIEGTLLLLSVVIWAFEAGVATEAAESLPDGFFFPLLTVAAPFPFDFLPFFFPAEAFSKSSTEMVTYWFYNSTSSSYFFY